MGINCQNERLEQEVTAFVPDKNYTIYEYMKRQPTFLIAVVSAIVAIMSFFINYLSYANTCRVLNYWGFDSSLVSVVDQKIFYSMCFSLLYAIFCFVAISLINNTFNAYQPYKETLIYIKNRYKKIKKQLKKQAKK